MIIIWSWHQKRWFVRTWQHKNVDCLIKVRQISGTNLLLVTISEQHYFLPCYWCLDYSLVLYYYTFYYILSFPVAFYGNMCIIQYIITWNKTFLQHGEDITKNGHFYKSPKSIISLFCTSYTIICSEKKEKTIIPLRISLCWLVDKSNSQWCANELLLTDQL